MEPIKHASVVNQIVERILDLIRTEGLGFDSKLPTEYELCNRLGVARSSLREAYRVLQARGYVTIKPGRGAFVSSPLVAGDGDMGMRWFDEQKVRYMDLVDVRACLEVHAVESIAATISDRALAVLARNIEEFASLMGNAENFRRLAELDQEFHHVLFAETHNRFMIEINDYIQKQMMVFRYAIMRLPSLHKNTYGPHQEILRQLRAHDVRAAARTMRDHLRTASNDMAELTMKRD
jgi:GntR family transcriptional repressor for pyruvate dehydrogenase complex